MKPIVNRLKDQYGDRVSFRLVNVAEPRGKALIQKLGGHHPVLLGINLKRGVVERRVGFQDEAELRQILEGLAG